jgi:hypothetical protein
MELCLAVISMVLVNVYPLTGNLIFTIVMVLARFRTLFALKYISLHSRGTVFPLICLKNGTVVSFIQPCLDTTTSKLR